MSRIANPDNITFDKAGNLWSRPTASPARFPSTTGSSAYPQKVRSADGSVSLLSAVVGAEVASLGFTPDSKTLFATIQHPGEGGSLAAPRSHWPDGPSSIARPAVIAVSREDGKTLAGDPS